MSSRLICTLLLGGFLVGWTRQGNSTASKPVRYADGISKTPLEPLRMLEPDVALFEKAFRMLLRVHETNEVAFLSFGYNPDENVYLDPPEAFSERFKDLPYKLFPVSAARLPRDGEMVSKDGYRGVEEKETGKPGIVYFVQVKTRTDREILLEVGVYGGPLNGGGSELRAIKEDGKWILTPNGSGWVS